MFQHGNIAPSNKHWLHIRSSMLAETPTDFNEPRTRGSDAARKKMRHWTLKNWQQGVGVFPIGRCWNTRLAWYSSPSIAWAPKELSDQDLAEVCPCCVSFPGRFKIASCSITRVGNSIKFCCCQTPFKTDLQQSLCVGLLVDSCRSERLLDSKSSHTLASQHPGLTLSYCDDILFECVDKCREFKWILRTVPGNTRSFAPTNWSAECAPHHPHLPSCPWPRPVAGCMWCLLLYLWPHFWVFSQG